VHHRRSQDVGLAAASEAENFGGSFQRFAPPLLVVMCRARAADNSITGLVTSDKSKTLPTVLLSSLGRRCTALSVPAGLCVTQAVEDAMKIRMRLHQS
jgi:hypothetical protein